MRVFSLVLGSMGLAPLQSYIFKQASPTRKQAKLSFSCFLQAPAQSLPLTGKAISILPKHLDEKGTP